NSRVRELRDALAAYLHCKRDELALLRNATEGNNVVCNGLDLKSGDEVLLTDQEHPGGRCCWEQRAARHGIKLNYVTLPRPPASANWPGACATGSRDIPSCVWPTPAPTPSTAGWSASSRSREI